MIGKILKEVLSLNRKLEIASPEIFLDLVIFFAGASAKQKGEAHCSKTIMNFKMVI